MLDGFFKLKFNSGDLPNIRINNDIVFGNQDSYPLQKQTPE